MKKMSILRRVRTEELKAIRRKFGDTGGRCHFRDHALRSREDGCSNALSTFDKDNYVLITYE